MQGIFCYLLENNELPYGHELAYAMNCTIVHELPTALGDRAIQFMKSQISNHEAVWLQFMTACPSIHLQRIQSQDG